MASRRRRAGARSAPFRRGLWLALAAAAVVATGWLLWPFWQLSGQFADQPARSPARLYARPRVLEIDRLARPAEVLAGLVDQGYRQTATAPERPGEARASSSRLEVVLRAGPTATGWRPAGRLEARFHGGRVAALSWEGRPVERAALEPPLLATLHGPERVERRPVALERVPEHLVQAVLAAEDAGFFEHPGLSPSGIARAAWVNLRGGELKQGGSTLTQQLVKNLFLTHERTLARKLREVALALVLELRYDKRSILQAYLNEIYWGSSQSVNLMGLGAAAWAYFGKQPEELELCESALLAGLIRSPGGYAPAAHPERARARRDRVLERMAELGWLGGEELASEIERPLCHSPQPVVTRRAPYFVDAALLEAGERFGLDESTSDGHSLLTTLSWPDQRQAEAAVAWGLEALENGWEKGRRTAGPLQAALVSLDPADGSILAYVGGRDWSASQFDRAGQARRQAGSAFKAVIYTAAFEHGIAWPAAFVEDAPMTVVLAGREWSPRNDDDEYRGWVTVRTAVERSLNLPTVRVALATDLERVEETARRLGIEGRLEALPALALGAYEVSPVELATAYATLAAGGLRPPVHALDAVLGPDGLPIAGRRLPEPARAVSPEAAYLMTSVLQGVLERGTGRTARVQGLEDPLAGKTGTTNGRRDSWFAGYSPDRASLVWVGYDDNSESRLSGARAALPIWARFTWKVRPSGGYRYFRQPPGIATALVDPATGQLATESCPEVMTEVYLEGRVPVDVCRLHGFWREWRPRRADQAELQVKRRWRWLKRIFGRGRANPRPATPP